jgi:FtsH-binding integral membrane protein
VRDRLVCVRQEEKGKGKEKEAADERAKKRVEEHEKGLQTVLQTLYESLAATLFMDTSIAALTRIFNVTSPLLLS